MDADTQREFAGNIYFLMQIYSNDIPSEYKISKVIFIKLIYRSILQLFEPKNLLSHLWLSNIIIVFCDNITIPDNGIFDDNWFFSHRFIYCKRIQREIRDSSIKFTD